MTQSRVGPAKQWARECVCIYISSIQEHVLAILYVYTIKHISAAEYLYIRIVEKCAEGNCGIATYKLYSPNV